MVMQTKQIRLTDELIQELNMLVDVGMYSSISEAIRDSVRRLVTGREAPIKNLPEKTEKTIQKLDKEVSKQFQKAKGTSDFYPEDMEQRKTIFRKFMKTAENYNFKQIEAPAFENTNLLTVKQGQEIRDQIFIIEKKGSEELGLRFDITVSATRMFIEKQKELPKPVKWFYLTRMWRYERPQTGRLREFYQYGVELFGSDKPEADAEILNLLIDSLQSLGLTSKDFFIKINNRKLLEGLLLDIVNKDIINDVIRIIDKRSKLSDIEFLNELKKLDLDDEKIAKITSTLNITNIKEIKTSDLNEEAENGLNEIKAILNLLKSRKEFIQVDLSTARGLAYYTGTVFECFDKEEKFRAIAGGGRYDKMVEQFKGEPTAATGFGLGYSTLTLLLKEKDLLPKINLAPDIYIITIGDVKQQALELATRLREKNRVDVDLSERNLRNQFKYANSIKAKKTIVLGENEIKQGSYKIKDMKTGKEEEVKL